MDFSVLSLRCINQLIPPFDNFYQMEEKLNDSNTNSEIDPTEIT